MYRSRLHKTLHTVVILSSAAVLCISVLYAQPVITQAPPLGSKAKQSLVSSQAQNQILPVEQAFPLQLFRAVNNDLILQWHITEGYYLYRKSLGVTNASGAAIELSMLPAGHSIEDEFFGAVEVFYDRLSFNIPLAALAPVATGSAVTTPDQQTITVSFQGCAKDLYCYPLQQLTIDIPSL